MSGWKIEAIEGSDDVMMIDTDSYHLCRVRVTAPVYVDELIRIVEINA